MSESAQPRDLPRIEVTVAAPVDAVWKALRDHDTIRHWHGWDYEGLDNEITTIYFTGVTEDADAHTLRVQGGDLFSVEEVEGGSRVRVTRAPHGSNPEWDAYYDDITEGWITFVQQLKFALERQAGTVRRTLFLSGRGGVSPVEALGLTDLARQPAGSAYAATLAGQNVTGTVWFRSDHQAGVTVDQWGDGLLVLGHSPGTDGAEAGAVMAVLSTYAVEQGDLDELDGRWTAWWRGHFPPADESADDPAAAGAPAPTDAST